MNKKVTVVATGGTIASRLNPIAGRVTATASGTELLAFALDRPTDTDIEVVEFCNMGSYLFDLQLSFNLSLKVKELAARGDVTGVVVTHGTDTMEESAFLADLVVGTNKPVVFTGAQRNADEEDRDGPRNLSQAIRLATAREARDLGAMILFDQEFHAARDVTKTHSYRVGAFQSAEHGNLGEVDGDRLIFHRRPELRLHFPATRIEPRVELVKLAMGSDDKFIRCALESGAKAIVIEAFGRGNANREVLSGAKDAIDAGVIVIITSRCPQGRVKPIYGNGGGRDFQ